MNNNTQTLTKILSGINNTLNIANKVVPIYKEAKPILNSVTSTYKKVKENGKDLSNIIKLIKIKKEFTKDRNSNFSKIHEQKLIQNTNNKINNPKFFI